MKVLNNFSVKQTGYNSSSTLKKSKRKKSSIGKEINYKNVKKAFKKNLIKDLSNQTFFNKDGTYSSLFHVAVEKEKKKLINFLLEQGINLKNVERRQPSLLKMMTLSRKLQSDLDLIERVIKAGANVNHSEILIGLHLTWLIESDPKVVKLLIQNGVDVHHPCYCIGGSRSTCLPLPAAIQHQRYQIIDLLLKKGVDVNKRCLKGPSALMWAVKNNNIHLTNHLLELGAFVNEIYHLGETVLHVAAECDKSEIVQLLISHELINLDTRNWRHYGTVVHMAVFDLALNSIDFILDANPDVNLFDRNNRLAVEVASHDKRVAAKSQAVTEKLIKHLVRLRAAEFHLNDRNVEAISEEKYQDIYAECCQQVILMKETKISSQSHLNFYDLLFINEQKLSLCLESLDDCRILEFAFEEKFSFYAGMIQYKLNKAYRWIKLRKALNDAVNILFNNDLPTPIMEILFTYFTVYELRKLRTYLEERDPGKSGENFQHSNLFCMDYDD